jgi:hypothetical protein
MNGAWWHGFLCGAVVAFAIVRLWLLHREGRRPDG